MEARFIAGSENHNKNSTLFNYQVMEIKAAFYSSL